MMRQIYITANGALTRPDGGLLPRRRGLCWRIRFANVLSPDLPTRAGRFLGRRRAADDQGSRFEGRDGRRRVPERRPREHDYGDVPDHGSEGRPSRRPRISRLPVPLDDLREEAEVPRARLCVPDATAAVSLVRVLDTLLPEISIDLGPLQHQAKLLEEHLTKLKQQARSVVPPEPIPSEMYR